jgi:hypothetical protein
MDTKIPVFLGSSLLGVHNIVSSVAPDRSVVVLGSSLHFGSVTIDPSTVDGKMEGFDHCGRIESRSKILLRAIFVTPHEEFDDVFASLGYVLVFGIRRSSLLTLCRTSSRTFCSLIILTRRLL